MKHLSISRLLGWSISIYALSCFDPLTGCMCATVKRPPNEPTNVSRSEETKPSLIKRLPNGKRCLLWDYTNTQQIPYAMDRIDFNGPIKAVRNWNTWTPPELQNRALFRPTVRGEAQLYGFDWNTVQQSSEPIIHFFSEPERLGIPAKHAADLWKQYMVPLRQTRGTRLVSPSCASDPAGRAWISEFMTYVTDCPPDYLGLHYYGSVSGDAIWYINSMHEQFPNYSLVLSEIASTATDKGQVTAFTAELANWMDATPWVFEYGFFGCMPYFADGFVSDAARLMNPDGSFTDLMNKLMYEQPMRV